mgnify:CR=1 FL=1
MSLGDLIALAFILVIFGGSSGLFTFVSTRLLLHKMQEIGFFVQAAPIPVEKDPPGYL